MRETSQREHGRWRRRGGEAQGQWVADFDLFKAALSHFEIHRQNYAVAAAPFPSPLTAPAVVAAPTKMANEPQPINLLN